MLTRTRLLLPILLLLGLAGCPSTDDDDTTVDDDDTTADDDDTTPDDPEGGEGCSGCVATGGGVSGGVSGGVRLCLVAALAIAIRGRSRRRRRCQAVPGGS